jgi:hypothetical protein
VKRENRQKENEMRQREEPFGIQCSPCNKTFSIKCAIRDYREEDYRIAGFYRGIRQSYKVSVEANKSRAWSKKFSTLITLNDGQQKMRDSRKKKNSEFKQQKQTRSDGWKYKKKGGKKKLRTNNAAGNKLHS